MARRKTLTERLYRYYRKHQMRVAARGGGTVTVYPSGRTEYTYGGSPYGEHALSAFISAKQRRGKWGREWRND